MTNSPRPSSLRGSDELGDRGADATVAGGGWQPGQFQRDSERRAQEVPVRGGDGDREDCPAFTSTAITGEARSASRDRPSRAGVLPRRVDDVPAAPYRVAGDVVAYGPGGGLGGNLVAPVLEPDLAGQPVAAVRAVGEVRERGGKPDLEPALVRVPPQRLISVRLVLFPVGREEKPRGVPPLPPLVFSEPCLGEVQPGAHRPCGRPCHRHCPVFGPPLDAGETAASALGRSVLACRSAGGGVPGRAAVLVSGGDRSEASIFRTARAFRVPRSAARFRLASCRRPRSCG